MEIKEAIQRFVQEWENSRHQKILQRFPSHEFEKGQVVYNKLFAIVHFGSGAYAHVALVDGENKHIGQYKVGDIFMPATWSRPAKHKRGSVFDNPMKCVGEYGVNYLR